MCYWWKEGGCFIYWTRAENDFPLPHWLQLGTTFRVNAFQFGLFVMGYISYMGYIWVIYLQRLWVRISGPAGIEGGDCEWTALSPPSIPWLRCPWARHRTPNCSPGAGAMAAHCSGCVFTVCVFTTQCCVCALGWVKCRGPISSMGHHIWQYITLLLSYSQPLFIFTLYEDSYNHVHVQWCYMALQGTPESDIV